MLCSEISSLFVVSTDGGEVIHPISAQDYINAGREFYSRFPKEAAIPWSGSLQKETNDTIDRFVDFQKDYVSSVRNASDKFIKETLNLTQNNVEKAFSLFDDYLTLFRV